MAGIGFELRKLLKNDSYFGLLSAYSYAGAVSSGPWLISIFGILVLSRFVKLSGMPIYESTYFQIVVVYLISGSLIMSSVLQQSYARFVADMCFDKQFDKVLPNVNGVLLLLVICGALVSWSMLALWLPTLSLQLKIVICASFVILSIIWVLTSVLSGLKAYKTIILAFLISYSFTFICGYSMRNEGLLGLLISYMAGQFLLLVGLLYPIYRHYPSATLIEFNFLKLNSSRMKLAFIGLFYMLSVWIDKFIFWYHPASETVLQGPLHYSLVYDIPIFLAYLCTIPTMTHFLLRVETDYMDVYQNFYKQICGGGTLSQINTAYQQLLHTTRTILFSVIKIQVIIQVAVVILGTAIFDALSLPPVYLGIFYIMVLAAGLSAIFWAILDIFFYLDKLWNAMLLTLFFLITNAFFTWISLQMGVFYFGYGIVVSLLFTLIISFMLLNRNYKNLIFATFVGW